MGPKEMKSFRLSEEVLQLLDEESTMRDKSVTSILEDCVRKQLGGESIVKLQQVIKLLKNEELIQDSGEEILSLDLTKKELRFDYSGDQGDYRVLKKNEIVELNRSIGAFVFQSQTRKEYFFIDSIFYIAVKTNED